MMWCSQVVVVLVSILTAIVHAGYQHNLPWQQYYTHSPQRWGSSKTSRIPRVRTGQGRYRMLGNMAELFCEFPSNYRIMSNVIWERADLSALTSLDEMYKVAGEEHKYRVITWPNGSRLQLMSPTPRARGLYRCLATGQDPHYPYPVTLFQDVPFYPDMRSQWLTKSSPPLRPQKPCCRGLSYDDFSHHTEYHVKSSLYFE